jgi:molybdate transport system substrate-binding protein
MREMARADGAGLVGCTQITEINNTPGVEVVGPLPRGYGLATTYSGAVCARAAFPDVADGFLALITGAESLAVRTRSGFEI